MRLFGRGAKRKTSRSAAGQPVYRYEREARLDFSGGDPELIEAITDHVIGHFGDGGMVMHQSVSPWVHVDLHVVPPSEERPWYTIVTSGMSEKPMRAPSADLAHAELVMALPPDWPMERESLADERSWWPFRLLQTLAALPHQFETWLWLGHTVPNDDPPEPYADGTRLCGALLAPPQTVPQEFTRLRVGDRDVRFFGVFALHADEMQLKLDEGFEALLEPFAQAGVTELVDPSRPSALA